MRNCSRPTLLSTSRVAAKPVASNRALRGTRRRFSWASCEFDNSRPILGTARPEEIRGPVSAVHVTLLG
jgi:hypothetical protein